MQNSFTPPPHFEKQALNGFKCLIAMLFISNISSAQINQSASSWSAAANNIYSTNSGNVGIGTSSPQYKLDVIGDVRISSNLFVGGGIVITDKVQAAHEVTTMSMRADSIVMDQTKAIYGTTRIEGDIDAKNKMDVQGNATFNGTLKISNLAGSSISKVYSDQQGNLFKGPGVPPTWECINGTPNWNIGGNNFSGLSSGYPGLVDANIGTCDDNDFILKSNNNPKIWLKGAAGNEFIGFGTATPLDKFHFTGGDVRIDGTIKNTALTGTGDRIVYVDANGNLKTGGTTPIGANGPCIAGATPWYEGGNSNALNNTIGTCDNSDLVLKANNVNQLWLKTNGWLGFGISSPADRFHFSGGDARFDNNVGIGTTSTPYRKLTVKGDVSFVNYGSTAGPGADAFEILGNSQIPTRRGISLEADPNGDMCFFVNNYQGGSGIPEFKFKNGIQSIPGVNPPPMATSFANAPDLMVIDGLGKVTLNNYYGNATDDAFIIKNGNSGVINFKVQANGQTQIGKIYSNANAPLTVTGNNTNQAIEVRGATSGVAEFIVSNAGTVYAREIRVKMGTLPDYVFEPTYKLRPLKEVEQFYLIHKHLPEVPSEKEVQKNDMNLGQMTATLLKKVEELTLYLVEQNNQLETAKKEIENLKQQLKK